ncbi:MarR family transcriptional regulator [Salmonella enterica subsp. enterica serovar Enteritidis]|nr:MarR family transcriptional regulator [Salmonella enterica subsp. enterica serovar Enteritidis]
MSENKNVQDTHISEQMKALHGALIRVVSALNRPRNDEKLIAEAGIQLDRALFSILISIERLGPIGVVELAERAGRDYTTVSRQVAKLEKLGLIIRQHNAIDRRIREAVISRTGKAMTERIDAAREQMGKVVFKDWPQDELKIVLEGFLPNNRVIISGLLKERLNANDVFYLVDNPEISIKIEQRFSEESQYRAVVENHEALICYLASHGERLDEYVDSSLFYKYPDAYRSVFSKKYGSLEIPSAGIHFTWDLIQKIKDKGGLISFITLHVASTEMLSNRKIQTKCVEEVTINEEYYEVPQATADIINTAKQNGGRIFAVGTTVTRCLESAYSREHNCLKASSGWTALYIHPGYQLKVVDCLLTNLHQPKTTHMVLTGQFAGVDLLMKAYASEDIQSCQFDMFGDCMLIIQDEG